MSHKAEIDNLKSEAGTHEERARELRMRAQKLIYADELEKYGIVDDEIVEYDGSRLRIFGINSWGRLMGQRIKKDGTEAKQQRLIYSPEKIKKVSASA
jgi:hypothetical protein